MDTPPNPWLPRRPLRDEAALNLFCFPHAGGASATYHRWAAEFPPAIDVIPVLLPGRERRIAEPAYDCLADLATAVADALGPHLGKPFAFFGQSMGALLAFELSRVLRKREAALPVHLFAAAHRAPKVAARSSPIHRLPDGEFIAAMQERYDGIPAELAKSLELLALFLPALRADVAAAESYDYVSEPPLDVPITAMGGVDDRQVSAADLAAWRLQTTREFRHKMFSGGHFFVNKPSSGVARIVQNRLERCLSELPS